MGRQNNPRRKQAMWLVGNAAVSLVLVGYFMAFYARPTKEAVSGAMVGGVGSYYVSSSGSDANDGKSESTSWKSIAKLNSVTFTSGDVIAFRCGDQFQGQINLNQSGVTLGSYGSGNKPIITGAQRLTGWNRYGSFGSIYVTRASGAVKNLFANGVQMTIARYPNSGLLPIATTDGKTTITATAINQATGDWTGANVRVRTVAPVFETRTVSASNGTTITLSSATNFPMNAGWGFYLDNKLAALDTAGEWYCDLATNSVYFWAPGGVDPNTLTVEGSVLEYGVNSSQSNVTVQGLEFRCQNEAALRFGGTTSNIQVRSNTVFGSSVDGIRFEGTSTNCTIDNNTVQHTNNRGIVLGTARQTTVSNNTVKNIGLVQGYGNAYDATNNIASANGSSGITLFNGSPNTTVRGNTLDSIGYIGIVPGGDDILVEGNIISHTMLKLADGGAIYMVGYSSERPFYRTIVRNNIIQDVVGNCDGMPAGYYTTACGIYLDICMYDTQIKGNTIVRVSDIGIFMQIKCCRSIICNNTLYECGTNHGEVLYLIQDSDYSYGQNVITKNIFYPGTGNPCFVLLQENKGSVIHSPGIIDSNYYCNPYQSSNPFVVYSFPTGKLVAQGCSFAQWKTVTGQDSNSSVGSQTLSGQGAGTKGTVKNSSSPTNQAGIYVNSSAQQKTVNLGSQSYRDLEGNPVSGSINLAPYSSKILIIDSSASKKATSVGKESQTLPNQFNLFQNYPNPFNPSTQIRYALPNEAKVRLEVYDLTGRRISLLVDENQTAGYHEVRFDGSRLASGSYFYRLQASAYSATRKFLLLK